MARLKLYDKPECPFCWKVRLALVELNLDAEVVHYLAPNQEQEWRALTPNSTVPVLLSEHGSIYESNVILEYLHDLTGALLPDSQEARINARLINKYSDGVIGSGLREVIFEKRSKPEAEWDLARIEQGREKFVQSLDFLEQKLEGQEFFTGLYSFPELALTARFALAEAYGVDIPEGYPLLRQWFQRMKARPSFAQTAPW